jgi:hypothetical protein
MDASSRSLERFVLVLSSAFCLCWKNTLNSTPCVRRGVSSTHSSFFNFTLVINCPSLLPNAVFLVPTRHIRDLSMFHAWSSIKNVLQLTLFFAGAFACLEPKLFLLILCYIGIVLITELLITLRWNVYFLWSHNGWRDGTNGIIISRV